MNEMVMTILRGAITVSLFALFIALIAWAWSPRRRKDFADAANLIFDESDEAGTRKEGSR
jgi:cytochrome c oxidase cbb3-type subunit 4